jgi:hypothetical protein
MKITAHPEYAAYAGRWQRVRDVVNGEAKLKAVDLALVSRNSAALSTITAVNYLRLINPTDISNWNTLRNSAYIKGARLYNATVKTLSGMMGMSFRVAPVHPEFPAQLEHLVNDVDGAGLGIDQQAQSIVSDVIQIGRSGLLTDMPRNAEDVQITQADVQNGFRATIQEYKAESIWDWHESIIGGVKKLDLLVLCEVIEIFADNRIDREEKKQFKVYRLTDASVTVQVFIDGEDGFESADEMVVMGANNIPLDEIPFTFIGSKNNSPSVDQLPLEPISDVNIGHYQESANLASSSFQLSACQPVVSDDNYARAQRNPEKGAKKVELGEESMIILGSGGSFALVSPPENNLSSGIQKSYEEQMIALGAQLITQGGGVETAEAARIKRASDVSDLEVIARNVSTGYTDSFERVARFMGVDLSEPLPYLLNTKFFETTTTPQQLAELVKTWQAGAVSKEVLDANLVAGGVIGSSVDLDEMNKNIADEEPMIDLDKTVEPES